MKKITTEEFIKKASIVHNGKYDYSKVEYVNADTKVCIICPEHGEFWQKPYKHLKGNGCPKCKGKFPKNEKLMQFIEKAGKIHNYKYDYSKVVYKNGHEKVCIVCPEHGEFWQAPLNHLNGQKCPKCSKKYMDNDYFIEKAKEIHGDKYDYSKVEYVNADTKVCIICPEHGEFWQTVNSHLSGCGCPTCAGNNRLTTEEFIKKARQVHGNKYDYSKTEYINRTTPVTITCNVHGDFLQKPSEHLSGNGCPECALISRTEKRKRSFKSFIEEAKNVHGAKYLYDQSTYSNMRGKIRVFCPIHGEFWQEADSHLRYNGCPKCSRSISENENEIFNFLRENINGEEILTRVRNIIFPKEIDIYIPKLKIGIEYNGNIWHSEKFAKSKNYHLNKMLDCENKGIRLIHIFEDEYVMHPEIVKSKLLHIIGGEISLQRIYGRKCVVKNITKGEAQEFLKENHIQGYGSSSVYIGAFYDNKLCGVMTFKKEKDGIWELTRCATDINKICCGVSGKLFSYFIKAYNPIKIKSFADRRWTKRGENLYTKLGFREDAILPPDYKYISSSTGIKRIHKFNFRKQYINKKYGLSLSLTEKEMAEELKIYRIWDCGLIRYVWTAEHEK